MRHWLVCLTGLLCFAAAPCAAQDSLAGPWTVTSSLWAQPHVCIFRQVGGVLTGDCAGPHGKGTSTGRVKGAAVSWDWNAVTSKRATVWRFAGALGADDAVRGSITHGLRRGRFIARRAALS